MLPIGFSLAMPHYFLTTYPTTSKTVNAITNKSEDLEDTCS